MRRLRPAGTPRQVEDVAVEEVEHPQADLPPDHLLLIGDQLHHLLGAGVHQPQIDGHVHHIGGGLQAALGIERVHRSARAVEAAGAEVGIELRDPADQIILRARDLPDGHVAVVFRVLARLVRRVGQELAARIAQLDLRHGGVVAFHQPLPGLGEGGHGEERGPLGQLGACDLVALARHVGDAAHRDPGRGDPVLPGIGGEAGQGRGIGRVVAGHRRVAHGRRIEAGAPLKARRRAAGKGEEPCRDQGRGDVASVWKGRAHDRAYRLETVAVLAAVTVPELVWVTVAMTVFPVPVTWIWLRLP